MKKNDVPPAIELIEVSKSFSRGAIRAVHEVSLAVRPGEIFGLIGLNGAGKTTLLKLAAGLLRPETGRALIAGISLAAEPLKARKLIGYAAAVPLLYERMTGYQYLGFIARAFGEAGAIVKKIEELALEFGIQNELKEPLGIHPPGLRRKVSLLSVLLRDPPALILDEPWAYLDVRAAGLVKQMLRERAARGRAVLFATYALDIAQKSAGRLGIMRQGVLAACGSFASLKKQSGKKGAPLEAVLLELSR